jgi:DNA repair photolyase
MTRLYQVEREPVRGILSRTTGFIAAAGFTHSLNPARNCTYGCTYCYVPTMRVYAGLRKEDWEAWGKHTAFKENAPELLAKQLQAGQRIYCSPLVDPYQPAEGEESLMPGILAEVARHPPAVFTIQTRSPGIVRDMDALRELSTRTQLRVSFSLTTNREEVRRWYEPNCESFQQRLEAIGKLREAGINVFATLAPLLPCDLEEFARAAVQATSNDIVGDPLHERGTKPRGATTRPEAEAISRARGFAQWHDPEFQKEIVRRIRAVVEARGRRFGTGPEAFGWLAR